MFHLLHLDIAINQSDLAINLTLKRRPVSESGKGGGAVADVVDSIKFFPLELIRST